MSNPALRQLVNAIVEEPNALREKVTSMLREYVLRKSNARPVTVIAVVCVPFALLSQLEAWKQSKLTDFLHLQIRLPAKSGVEDCTEWNVAIEMIFCVSASDDLEILPRVDNAEGRDVSPQLRRQMQNIALDSTRAALNRMLTAVRPKVHNDSLAIDKITQKVEVNHEFS